MPLPRPVIPVLAISRISKSPSIVIKASILAVSPVSSIIKLSGEVSIILVLKRLEISIIFLRIILSIFNIKCAFFFVKYHIFD